MKTASLTERAAELLSDLVDFTEKTEEELVEEALYFLTHSYNGTEPLRED